MQKNSNFVSKSSFVAGVAGEQSKTGKSLSADRRATHAPSIPPKQRERHAV